MIVAAVLPIILYKGSDATIVGHKELPNFLSFIFFPLFFFFLFPPLVFFLANLKFVKVGLLLDHCPLIFRALHLPQTSRGAAVHADSSRSRESPIYLALPAEFLLINWGFTASF